MNALSLRPLVLMIRSTVALSVASSIASLACTLDVGDALSSTDSLTTIASGPAGDTGDGETEATDDGDGGSGVTGASPIPGADDGAAPGADTSGGFGTDGGDTDGGVDTDGGESGEAGEVAPVCLDWGVHAESCGFGSDAADFCALDLEVGALTSSECLDALEQYYACLGATDCTTLLEQGDTACGRQDAITICGFESE